MNDDLSILSQFHGRARLFPLPNFVLFPCVIHPLHIFEPRYRQMTADALTDDKLIAMALLKPGWEEEYHQQPAIFSVTCLGKIISSQRLDDGRYNLLLRGVSRARIVEEIATGKLYRSAQLELLPGSSAISSHEERRLRRHLSEQVPNWFSVHPQLVEQFQKLLESDLSLGTMADIISFAVPLDPEIKQQLLEELDVERRVEHLLGLLKSASPPPAKDPGEGARRFPPEFSSN